MRIGHIGNWGSIGHNGPQHSSISLKRLLWGIGALLLASFIPIYLQTASTSAPPMQLVRLFMAIMLVWWMPGALLILHIRPANLNLATSAVLAVGLGLSWMMRPGTGWRKKAMIRFTGRGR